MARIGQDKDLSGNDVSLLIEVLFLVVFSEPVWNLGDSYFVRGKERARKTEGLNMGLRGVEVRWLGLRGMSCIRHFPCVFSDGLYSRGRNAPDVLLIHCEGNDLGDKRQTLIVNVMQQNLEYLHRCFPLEVCFSNYYSLFNPVSYTWVCQLVSLHLNNIFTIQFCFVK